jgi:outer membrane protein OmpA-like peptidoglycan-associated protein
VLKDFDDVNVEISGHTDSDGNRDHNVDLSRRRADAVKKYLVDKGIAEGRLSTRGAGPDEPIAKPTTPRRTRRSTAASSSSCIEGALNK